jgi:hypothetical protein
MQKPSWIKINVIEKEDVLWKKKDVLVNKIREEGQSEGGHHSLREWDSLLLGRTVWPLSDLCQTKYLSITPENLEIFHFWRC